MIGTQYVLESNVFSPKVDGTIGLLWRASSSCAVEVVISKIWDCQNIEQFQTLTFGLLEEFKNHAFSISLFQRIQIVDGQNNKVLLLESTYGNT